MAKRGTFKEIKHASQGNVIINIKKMADNENITEFANSKTDDKTMRKKVRKQRQKANNQTENLLSAEQDIQKNTGKFKSHSRTNSKYLNKNITEETCDNDSIKIKRSSTDDSESNDKSDISTYITDMKNFEVITNPSSNKIDKKDHFTINNNNTFPNITKLIDYTGNEDDTNFTLVKGKRIKNCSIQSSEFYANEAIKLIVQNKLLDSIKYLTNAIQLHPDPCYYVNRGFCYLRLGVYECAKTDAKLAMKHAETTTVLIKAKYILAQANKKKFCVKAEEELKECLKLMPSSAYIQRELLQTQITQLMILGFSEKEAVHSLFKHFKVLDAKQFLKEKIGKTLIEKNERMADYNYENEIYYSDDEDHVSCNTKKLLDLTELRLKQLYTNTSDDNAHMILQHDIFSDDNKKQDYRN